MEAISTDDVIMTHDDESQAGTSPELRKWMFDTLQCVVTDGYGTTETGMWGASGYAP